MSAPANKGSETYQQRFNRRHWRADRFTWAHRHLPERVRMWSPWWLRHVVAVERTLHESTMAEMRDKSVAWDRWNP